MLHIYVYMNICTYYIYIYIYQHIGFERRVVVELQSCFIDSWFFKIILRKHSLCSCKLAQPEPWIQEERGAERGRAQGGGPWGYGGAVALGPERTQVRNCSPRRPGHRWQADSEPHDPSQTILESTPPRLGLHSLGLLPHVSHEFKPFTLVMWE